MKPKRPVLAIRLDAETEGLIHALGAKLGLSMSAVVRLCVRRVAELEGIPLRQARPAAPPQEPETPKQHAAA